MKDADMIRIELLEGIIVCDKCGAHTKHYCCLRTNELVCLNCYEKKEEPKNG